MNIFQPKCSSSEDSEELLKLAYDLVDVKDTANKKEILQINLIGCYISHIDPDIQLIVTGSTVENTKLNERVNGSDLDIMVVPRNLKINTESLQYNKRYPSFLRVSRAHLAEPFSSKIKGDYLPTLFLKNMKHLGVDLHQIGLNFIERALYHPKRLLISSESSVGLQFSTLYSPSYPGLISRLSEKSGNNRKNGTNCQQGMVSSEKDINLEQFPIFNEMIEKLFEFITKDIDGTCVKNDNNDMSKQSSLASSCNKSTKDKDKRNCPSVRFNSRSNADIVPGLMIDGWPSPAAGWISRKRFWPDDETVRMAVAQGVAIVSKPLPMNPNEAVDFRLSFSLVEKKLSDAMNETQRLTVIIIKACNKIDGPSELVSYHIKTALYWASEGKPLSFWTLNNLSSCVKSTIGYLLTCTRRQYLPFYFIPSMNLFAAFDEYCFHELEEKLLLMYHQSISFVKRYIDQRLDTEDAVYGVDGDRRDALITPTSSSGRHAIKMAYKHCVGNIVGHLMRLEDQGRPLDIIADNIAKAATCRTQLERLGREASNIDDVILNLMQETKHCQNPKMLLKDCIQVLINKYR